MLATEARLIASYYAWGRSDAGASLDANDIWRFAEAYGLVQVRFNDGRIPFMPSLQSAYEAWFGRGVPDLLHPVVAPLFMHYCDECEYLGRSGAVDLYWCKADGTPLARYSNERDDVSSTSDSAVLEAQRRAVALGLAVNL